MLFQSFSEASLKRTLRPADFFGDHSYRTIDDLEPIVAQAAEVANSDEIKFASLQKCLVKNKSALKLGELRDELIVRKLNDTIMRVFKTKQSNRNYICRNVKRLLGEKVDYSVIKCDIATFFESIPREQLQKDILSNRIFSPETKRVLVALFNSSLVKESPGLPRGLSISGTLSEKYLEDFDRRIKRIPEIYFFARFVDDIIAFSSSKSDSILSLIRDELKQLSLSINEDKTAIFRNEENAYLLEGDSSVKTPDFSFLGYRFRRAGYKGPVSVLIAEKKVNKIKSRVAHSFLDYAKTGEGNLLEDRLRFLTGNYFVSHHSSNTPLRAGVFYAYPLASSASSQLKDLDQFLKAQIFSSNNIPSRRGRPIPSALCDRLGKYSFCAGYIERKVSRFSQSRIAEIKKCWHNV